MPTSNARRAVDAILQDLRIAGRHLVYTRIAGSSFTPRPVRYLVYRAMGLDVRTMNVFSGVRITGKDLHIGPDTFVNHDCYFEVGRGRIEIGERCHLGPQVMILTSSHELHEDGSVERLSTNATTSVGDRVWLGARTTLLPGATVESDCVVAAGAVVTGRCESGGIYGGVPAKRIGDTARRREPLDPPSSVDALEALGEPAPQP